MNKVYTPNSQFMIDDLVPYVLNSFVLVVVAVLL